jgi:hypothetical protein
MKTYTLILDKITKLSEREEIFKFMGTRQLVEIKREYNSDPLDSIVNSAYWRKVSQVGVVNTHEFRDSNGNQFYRIKFNNTDHSYLFTDDMYRHGKYNWFLPDTLAWLTSVEVAMEYILKNF